VQCCGGQSVVILFEGSVKRREQRESARTVQNGIGEVARGTANRVQPSSLHNKVDNDVIQGFRHALVLLQTQWQCRAVSVMFTS